jgi:peptide/nickel transport system permease protein
MTGTTTTLVQVGDALRRFWRRSIAETARVLWRNPRAFAGLIILLVFALMAAVGPELFPMDMTASYEERYAPVSLRHPLSTDYIGRDVLHMIIHGSRDVLTIAFIAGVITVAVGVVVGLLAGLQGGWVDAVLMLLTTTVLTVPQFPVMLMLGALLTIRDPVTFGLVLSVWSWGRLARTVRSQILSLKEREFIEAARTLGLSTRHIIFRELLPNIMPYVAINFMTTMRVAIVASVGLMFLGLVPMSSTNWGMMLSLATGNSQAIYVPRAIVYVLSPMAAIVLFQLGAVLFAHGLDEIFDPRLRS